MKMNRVTAVVVGIVTIVVMALGGVVAPPALAASSTWITLVSPVNITSQSGPSMNQETKTNMAIDPTTGVIFIWSGLNIYMSKGGTFSLWQTLSSPISTLYSVEANNGSVIVFVDDSSGYQYEVFSESTGQVTTPPTAWPSGQGYQFVDINGVPEAINNSFDTSGTQGDNCGGPTYTYNNYYKHFGSNTTYGIASGEYCPGYGNTTPGYYYPQSPAPSFVSLGPSGNVGWMWNEVIGSTSGCGAWAVGGGGLVLSVNFLAPSGCGMYLYPMFDWQTGGWSQMNVTNSSATIGGLSGYPLYPFAYNGVDYGVLTASETLPSAYSAGSSTTSAKGIFSSSVGDLGMPNPSSDQISYPVVTTTGTIISADVGSPNVEVYVTVGTPAAPTLTPQAGGTSMGLSWVATNNATEYLIFRNGVQIGTSATPSYTDTGLTPNTQYTYTVAATDTNYGITSPQSPPSSAYTLAAPVTFTLTPTQTSIGVTWTANGNPSGTNYAIEYSPDGTTWTQMASTTTTSGTISGLTSGTEYYVTVWSENGAGVWTQPAAQNTWTIPATPTSPTATVTGLGWSSTQGRDIVQLLWSAVPGATGYDLLVQDGYTWRVFDVGNVTSWDSSQSLIWPDNSLIAQYGHNSRTVDLFNHTGGGFDLADNPAALYWTAAASTYWNNNDYFFAVEAYDAGGTSPMSTVTSVTPVNQMDTTVPQVSSVIVNGGVPYTSSTSVSVVVKATEGVSGITQIQLSSDNGVWQSTPINVEVGGQPQTSIDYTVNTFDLPPGAGQKNIYVRVYNAAGAYSTGIGTVALEQPSPVNVNVTWAGGITSTSSQTVQADVQTTAPQPSQMRWQINGGAWTAWTAWTPNPTITLSTQNPPPAGTYTVTVEVEDQSGMTGEGSAVVSSGSASTGVGPITPENTSGAALQTATINGGAVYVANNQQLEMAFTFPSGSAPAEVQFGIGGASTGPWTPYVSTLPVTVPADGLTTLTVQFEMPGGSVSQIYDVPLFVSTTAPDLAAQWVGGVTATTTGSMTAQISVSDTVLPVTDLTYSVDGGSTWTPVPGATFTVSVPLPTSGPNTITIEVRDPAGNIGSATLLGWNL